MGLLQDIQMGAVDPDVDLSKVLRQCMILAYKLDYEPFKQWVEHELNGYPDGIEIPPYRIVGTQSYGDFYGPLQSGYRNCPIPSHALPESYREMATTFHFREGISKYAAIPDNGEFKAHWDSNALVYVRDKVMEGYVLVQAWRPFSVGTFHGLLDAVRNRVLEFALKIEAENPNADKVPSGAAPIAKETVNNIYNMTMFGGQAAVGGTGTFEQIEKQVKVGDIDSLHEALKKLGVPEESIDELDELIDEVEPEEVDKPQGRIPEWAKKAGSTIRDTTVEVGSKVLMDLVKQYVGMP